MTEPGDSVKGSNGLSFSDALVPLIVRGWLALAAQVLLRDREILNDANVFPVADSDTGTNMSVTLRAAAQGVADTAQGASGAELLAMGSRWALSAARGNSGVILAEWIRGFALAIGRQTKGQNAPHSLGVALAAAADAARNAVVDPAPGSILTAMQAAAEAARDYEHNQATAEVGSVIDAAVVGAQQAAVNSPNESAVLARAGVLDSGACGFVLVLAALQKVIATLASNPAGDVNLAKLANSVSLVNLSLPISGAALITPPNNSSLQLPDVAAAAIDSLQGADLDSESSLETGTDQLFTTHTDLGEDGFEVMFNLERPANANDYQPGSVVKLLRKQLSDLGNSVVVIGGSATDIDLPSYRADSPHKPQDAVTKGAAAADSLDRGAASLDRGATGMVNAATHQGVPSAWHAHVHVPELEPVMKLVDEWRGQGSVSGEQVRFLAAPRSKVAIWAQAADPAVVKALAEFGVTVQVVEPGDTAPDTDLWQLLQSELSSQIVAIIPDSISEQHLPLAANEPTNRITAIEVPNEAATIAVLLSGMGEGDITEVNSAQPFQAVLNELTATTLPVAGVKTTLETAISQKDVQLAVVLLPSEAPSELTEQLEKVCAASDVELLVQSLASTGPAQLALIHR